MDLILVKVCGGVWILAKLVLGFHTQISQPAGLRVQEITNSNILLLIYGHRQKAEHTESER